MTANDLHNVRSNCDLGTPSFDNRELVATAKRLFLRGSLVRRKFQHWRPRICPFESILPYVPAGSSLLDIGCGCGLFLGLLASAGKITRGVGFDVDRSVIETARKMAIRAAELHPGTSLTFYLGADLTWPPGEFDAVSLIDVMHHLPPARQKPFFAKVCQRVRVGGVLIYKDMCRRPRWRAWANRLHDLLLARQHIHYVPIESVEAWAGECGMQLVDAQRINRLWYGHELRVLRRMASNLEALSKPRGEGIHEHN